MDNPQRFKNLRSQIQSYPRQSGNYYFDFKQRTNVTAEDDVAQLFAQLDLVTISSEDWIEYEASKEVAKNWLKNALIGGSEIGHTKNTIEPTKAEDFAQNFFLLFDSNAKYYTNQLKNKNDETLSNAFDHFGNRDHVYSYGVAIVDNKNIGIIWIVESD